MQLILTADLLLKAYAHGLFPMAYSAHSPYLHWVCPEKRGQLSIDALHIPRRLQKTLRAAPFDVRIDSDFRAVIESCAAPGPKRPDTWINEEIIKAYTRLHEFGHAHSVECWQDGALVGGVYGLEIGGAFFGESMFSRVRDASKIALVHLTARLWKGGFTLLDTQFVNAHLKQFGAYEIPHAEYIDRLEAAMEMQGDFKLHGVEEADLLEDYLAFRKGS